MRRHRPLGLALALVSGIAALGGCGSSGDPKMVIPGSTGTTGGVTARSTGGAAGPGGQTGAAATGGAGPEAPGTGGAQGTGGATGASAGTTGAAGMTGLAGTGGAAGAGSPGGAAAGRSGSPGGVGAAGTAGAGGGTGPGGTAGAQGVGGSASFGGIPGLEDLSTMKPSPGCGTDPATAYPGIMPGMWQPMDRRNYMSGYQIAIVSPPNHPVVPGNTLQRRYFIRLPPAYDRTHAYKMIYEGTGCTGYGTDVPTFDQVTGGQAIQIAVEPYPGIWQNNCFDDKRGMLTIEAPFIEALHEKLRGQLCFDEHRVFISGHSSGAWLSNQFGCAYGSKIFRAISPSSGGLAQGTQQQPCNGLPTAGIWWHGMNDGTNPYQGTVDAINHALMVNKCTPNFMTSPRVAAPYPNVTICQKFSSCPAEFPVVVCTTGNGDHRSELVADQLRATWQFFNSF